MTAAVVRAVAAEPPRAVERARVRDVGCAPPTLRWSWCAETARLGPALRALRRSAASPRSPPTRATAWEVPAAAPRRPSGCTHQRCRRGCPTPIQGSGAKGRCPAGATRLHRRFSSTAGSARSGRPRRGGPERRRRPVDGCTASAEGFPPVRRTALKGGVPHRDVLGVLVDIEHVVARSARETR
jgi:hypothetical protein